MSYCRFQNTLPDLRDCYENWDSLTDGDESDKEELSARKLLLELCADVIRAYGDQIGVTVCDLGGDGSDGEEPNDGLTDAQREARDKAVKEARALGRAKGIQDFETYVFDDGTVVPK